MVEQVMKHYGNAILAAVTLLLLGAIIYAALSGDGYVADQFEASLKGFFEQMNTVAGMASAS